MRIATWPRKLFFCS